MTNHFTIQQQIDICVDEIIEVLGVGECKCAWCQHRKKQVRYVLDTLSRRVRDLTIAEMYSNLLGREEETTQGHTTQAST